MDPIEKVEEHEAVDGGGIDSVSKRDLSKIYTYADYFRWKFDERVELLKGYIHKMSPAPGSVHQRISTNILLEIGSVFKGTICQVFAAPFDVRLPENNSEIKDKQVFTVVQPDICVVCDTSKIDSRGCIGAPDLVVEVLSPGNTKKEMGIKYDLYEKSGVKEYWMVDPGNRIVLIYVLENGKYVGLKPVTNEEVLKSSIFSELKFQLKNIFE